MALGHVADRHGDRGAGVGDGGTTNQAVGGLQSDATDRGITEVLLNLEGDLGPFASPSSLALVLTIVTFRAL